MQINTSHGLQNTTHLYQPYCHICQICLCTLTTDMTRTYYTCPRSLIVQLYIFYPLTLYIIKPPRIFKHRTAASLPIGAA